MGNVGLEEEKGDRASKKVHSFVMLLKFQTRSKLKSDNKGCNAVVDAGGVGVGVGVGKGVGVGVVIFTLPTAVIPPAVAQTGWSPRGNTATSAVTLKAPCASELAAVELRA